MSITQGQTALASDFIDTSAGAGDVGKVPKLNVSGKLDASFVSAKFGGDGSDGALSVSSGTTTIDMAGAKIFVKNYTSIAITGTGKVSFINPHASGTMIILKSQGAMTLTSSQAPMLDASGCGAAGGAQGIAFGSGGNASKQNAGTDGKIISVVQTAKGSGTTAGGLPVIAYSSLLNDPQYYEAYKYPHAFCGAGAASGQANEMGNNTPGCDSGFGGNGGPALIVECGGAWNFTTIDGISVAGGDGGNATRVTNGNAGGGGGGAGGYFLGLYNILIANSGTVKVSGGVGGTGLRNNGNQTGGGGGSSQTVGTNGTTSGTSGAKTGGDGGVGLATTAKNTIFN